MLSCHCHDNMYILYIIYKYSKYIIGNIIIYYIIININILYEIFPSPPPGRLLAGQGAVFIIITTTTISTTTTTTTTTTTISTTTTTTATTTARPGGCLTSVAYNIVVTL